MYLRRCIWIYYDNPLTGLVVEDAISGIRSGKAAGALVLAVCTSTSREAIVKSQAGPDYIVTDLTKVSARWTEGKVEVTIDEAE